MARPKNPRIEVYAVIREAGQIYREMAATWSQRAKVRRDGPLGPGERRYTSAPDDQQPENDLWEWGMLQVRARQLREMADRIEALAKKHASICWRAEQAKGDGA